MSKGAKKVFPEFQFVPGTEGAFQGAVDVLGRGAGLADAATQRLAGILSPSFLDVFNLPEFRQGAQELSRQTQQLIGGGLSNIVRGGLGLRGSPAAGTVTRGIQDVFAPGLVNLGLGLRQQNLPLLSQALGVPFNLAQAQAQLTRPQLARPQLAPSRGASALGNILKAGAIAAPFIPGFGASIGTAGTLAGANALSTPFVAPGAPMPSTLPIFNEPLFPTFQRGLFGQG